MNDDECLYCREYELNIIFRAVLSSLRRLTAHFGFPQGTVIHAFAKGSRSTIQPINAQWCRPNKVVPTWGWHPIIVMPSKSSINAQWCRPTIQTSCSQQSGAVLLFSLDTRKVVLSYHTDVLLTSQWCCFDA